MALINALVLTIPYGVAVSMNNDFWDWLQSTYETNEACSTLCPDPEQCFMESYRSAQNSAFGTVYTSITVLCATGIYYILRPSYEPKEDDDDDDGQVPRKDDGIKNGAANRSTVTTSALHDDVPTVTNPGIPHTLSKKDIKRTQKAEIFRQWWEHARIVH